ncbi:MAG: HmuY family protein [Bacteroidales bacterium]|nr:HmuY family protein [Bacteroidales bacterium]
MKRQMKTAAAVLLGCLALVACKDKEKDNKESAAAAIEATESGVWHYFSLTAGKEVGSGKESDSANTVWFARTDWDFAVNKYQIRTNSGEATSVGSKGGVYTFADGVSYAGAVLPDGAEFAVDKAITSSGMGGETTVVKSEATVIVFKTNEDGSLVMPPVYLKAPVYAFRTADGLGYYKVEFTQYQNDAGESGHVEFNFVKMN